jgi:hypothetical protein
MTYPFRQGIDYGPRKGTLGLAFHMAEGGDGTVQWLAQRSGESRAEWIERVRGVSANAVILSDGTIWQMVDWNHASGSMNPKDRGPMTGYYNRGVIQSVLGAGWTDPNAWSLSCEIAGFRSKGPTDLQVAAAIRWGLDMARQFPTLRGAYGHADQTNTKGCPGLTPNMRNIFDQLGGHGLWTEDEMRDFTLDREFCGDVEVTIDGASALRLDDGALIPVKKGETKRAMAFGELDKPLGTGTGAQADRQSGWLLYGPRPAWLLAYAGREVPTTGGETDTKRFVAIAVDGIIDKSTEILV